MSTKSTITHGPDFHLYRELGDRSNVYLEINTTNFEAGYGRVMVQVPLHVWEHLRSVQVQEYDLADLSDEEIVDKARQEVERVRGEYEGMKAEGRDLALRAFVYRQCERPFAEHVAIIERFLRDKRDFQRQVRGRTEQLKVR